MIEALLKKNTQEQVLGVSLFPPAAQELVQAGRWEELEEKYPLRCQYLRIKSRDEHELANRQTILRALNNLDTYIQNYYQQPHEQVLYASQMPVLESIRNEFERGNLTGYIPLPTGSGKSVILSQLAEAMNLSASVITSRVNLVGDLADTFATHTDMEAGVVHAKAKETDQQITIGTYNALRDGKIPSRPLLMLDEVHNALGPQTSVAVSSYPSLFKVGFTATPDYDEERSVAQLLGPLMHRISVEEAVRYGLCSPFSVLLVESGIDTRDIPQNRKEWARKVNKEALMRTIVTLHEQKFSGRKAVIACNTSKETEEMTALFETVGRKATYIHSGLPVAKQTDNLRKHQTSEAEILCGVKIPAEGYDDKEIEIVYFLGAVDSEVKVQQFAGRALRINRNKPEKEAVIVHVYNPGELGVTYTEAAGTTGGQSTVTAGNLEVPNSTYGAKIIVRPTEIYATINVELKRLGLPNLLQEEDVAWMSIGEMLRGLNEGKTAHPSPKFNNELHNIIGALSPRVRHLVERYMKTKNYRWTSMHYHPWVYDQIKEKYEQMKNWPEGYNDVYFISRALRRKSDSVLNEIDRRQRAKRMPPVDIQTGIARGGHVIDLYPESLITHLADYKRLPEPPEDYVWYSLDQLKKMGIHPSRALRIIQDHQLPEQYPSWFGHFSNPQGRSTDYYRQEFVDFLVSEEARSVRKEMAHPERWYSLTRARKPDELGVGGAVIFRFIEEYGLRESSPDWFADTSVQKQNTTVYSEELFSALFSFKVSEGDITAKEFLRIASKQGISSRQFQQVLQESIDTSDPYIQPRMLLNELNQWYEYLPHALVQRINDRLGIR